MRVNGEAAMLPASEKEPAAVERPVLSALGIT